MADEDRTHHRLQSVEIDEDSLAAVSRDQEQERQIAIFDLLEENYFFPEGAATGPYDLRMGLLENSGRYMLCSDGVINLESLFISTFS